MRQGTLGLGARNGAGEGAAATAADAAVAALEDTTADEEEEEEEDEEQKLAEQDAPRPLNRSNGKGRGENAEPNSEQPQNGSTGEKRKVKRTPPEGNGHTGQLSQVDEEVEEEEEEEDVVLGDVRKLTAAADVVLGSISSTGNAEANDMGAAWVDAVETLVNCVRGLVARDDTLQFVQAELKADGTGGTTRVAAFVETSVVNVAVKLFFRTNIAVEHADLVNSFFAAVLQLGLKLMRSRLERLNHTLLMLLDGAVQQPRASAELSSSLAVGSRRTGSVIVDEGSAKTGAAKPRSPDCAVIDVATAVHAIPGIKAFYRGHGQPRKVVLEGVTRWYWPHETEAVRLEMEKQIGRVFELRPILAKPPSGAASPPPPAGASQVLRVQVLAFSLRTNMFLVKNFTEPNEVHTTWIDVNDFTRTEIKPAEALRLQGLSGEVGLHVRLRPAADKEICGKLLAFDRDDAAAVSAVVQVKHAEGGEERVLVPNIQCCDVDVLPPPVVVAVVEDRARQADAPERFVSFPPAARRPEVSHFLIDNINAFGSAGGFDAMADRIARSDDLLPLGSVMAFIRAMLCVQLLMEDNDQRKRVWKRAANAMFESVCWRLDNFTDSELRSVQQEPKILWHLAHVGARLAPYQKGSSAAGVLKYTFQTIAERMILRVMAAFLRLVSIESRLFGLNSILDAVRVHSVQQGYAVSGNTTQRPTVFGFSQVGREWLCDWLNDCVVKQLYENRNLHFEILRRSTAVVLFLGRELAIKGEHFQIIWKASVGRDYASMRIMHNLIISLMPKLTQQQRTQFFAQSVAKLPFAEYDQQGEILRFVSQLTTVCLEADAAQGRARQPKIPRNSSAKSLPLDAPGSGVDLAVDTSDEADGPGLEKSPSVESVPSASTGSGSSPKYDTAFPWEDDEWYGLPLLWAFIQDDVHGDGGPLASAGSTTAAGNSAPGTSSAVGSPKRAASGKVVARSLEQRREAIHLLVNLLSKDSVCGGQRDSVVEACISNIHDGLAVPQSLELLKRIISEAPRTRGSWFSLTDNRRSAREIMIERLDKQHKLVRLLCDDLGRYQTKIKPFRDAVCKSEEHLEKIARARAVQTMTQLGVEQLHEKSATHRCSLAQIAEAERMRKHAANARVDHAVDSHHLPGSCYAHVDQLEARFDFLLFVLTNSYLCIKRQLARELWASLVVNAHSSRSRDLALSWFGRGHASGLNRLSQLDQDGLGNGSGATGSSSASKAEGFGSSGGTSTGNDPLRSSSSPKSQRATLGGGDKNGNGSTTPGAGDVLKDGGEISPETLVSKNSVLSDDVPNILFKEEMQELDVVSLSPTALRVFQSFFLSISYRNKSIRRSGDHQGPFVVGGRRVRRDQEARALARAVVGSDHATHLFEYVERSAVHLEGINFLWRVAVEAERNDVGFAAIAQLVHLHVRLSVRLKSKRENRLHYDFVHRCVDKILEAHQDSRTGNPPASDGQGVINAAVHTERMLRQARRASTALKLFLSHFRVHKPAKLVNLVVIPPAIGFPGSLTRRDWISLSTGTSFHLQVDPDTTTLRQLREQIASHIKVEASSIEFRLVNNPCRVDDRPTTDGDLDGWFRSSDYKTFSRNSPAPRRRGSNCGSSGVTELLGPKAPFTEADLGSVLADLGIQDWDSFKVCDVKVEKPIAAQGRNGKKETSETNSRNVLQREQQMRMVAQPFISKSLEIAYADPSKPALSRVEQIQRKMAGQKDCFAIHPTRLQFDAVLLHKICSDLLDVVDSWMPDTSQPGTSHVSQDEIASRQVWECLQVLPVDGMIVKEIDSLDCGWNVLLPVDSMHRMMYALRIINRNLQGASDQDQDIVSLFWSQPVHQVASADATLGAGWSQVDPLKFISRFLDKGGMRHLQNVLAEHKKLVGGRREDCLCMVVKIISELLFRETSFRERIVQFLESNPVELVSSPTSAGSQSRTASTSSSTTLVGKAKTHVRRISKEALGLDRSTSSSQGSDDRSSGEGPSEESGFRRFSNLLKVRGRRGKRGSDLGSEGKQSLFDGRASLLEQLDFSSMIANLMEAMLVSTEVPLPVVQMRLLVQQSMYLIMSCICLGGADAFAAFTSFHGIRTWTERLMIFCDDADTRFLSCQMILALFARVNNTCDVHGVVYEQRKTFALDYLLTVLPIMDSLQIPIRVDVKDSAMRRRIHRNLSQVCKEFYLLLCGLIDMIDEVPSSADGLRKLARQLQPRPSARTVDEIMEEDEEDAGTQEEQQGQAGNTCQEPSGASKKFSRVKLFVSIFDRAMDALILHDSLESFHSDREDNMMIGLLRLLRSLIKKEPTLRRRASQTGLVHVLYQEFLFTSNTSFEGDRQDLEVIRNKIARHAGTGASPDTDAATKKSFATNPKGLMRRSMSGHSLIIHDRSARCKTEESRDMALALLVELCEDSPFNMSLLSGILSEEGLAGSGRRAFEERFAKEWNYNPIALTKHPAQFTGLKNQGATCYMNSLLQQLYHIPTFAEAILGIGSASAPDSLLHHLQITFGSLRVSTKHFYDTMPLCKVLRNADGSAISLTEQKDANEFATHVFELLEGESEEARKAVDQHFGGTLVNQVISKDAENPYVSEKLEPFHILPLDIKGSETLTDALDAMVQSELLTGDNQYRLDSGECVDAIKRTCIKEAPPHLIVNLKRFQFDLQTLTKSKVNDRFEFPLVLDLEPYTYDYLMRQVNDETSGDETSPNNGVGAVGGQSVPSSGGSSNFPGLMSPGSFESLMRSPEQVGASTTGSRSTTTATSLSNPGTPVPGLPVASAAGEDNEATKAATKRFEYELVGIIAHTGTMDSGHYFSLVRERRPRFPKVGGQWLEFNDKLVWPYPIDRIPGDCFGGFDQVVRADGTVANFVKQRSAYILVYDRKWRPEIPEADEDLHYSPSIWNDLGDFETLDQTTAELEEGLCREEDDDLDDLDDLEDLQVDEDLEGSKDMKDRVSSGSVEKQGEGNTFEEDASSDVALSLLSGSHRSLSLTKTVEDDIDPGSQRSSRSSPTIETNSDENAAAPSNGNWDQFALDLGIDQQGANLLRHFMFKRKRRFDGVGFRQQQQQLVVRPTGSENMVKRAAMLRLPSHVVDSLLNDNLTFIRRNYAFEPATYKFLWNVMRIGAESGRPSTAFIVLKTSIVFLTQVASHAWAPFVQGILVPWRNQIISLVHQSPDGARWCLEQYGTRTSVLQMFYVCPKLGMRHVLVEILLQCHRVLLDTGDAADAALVEKFVSLMVRELVPVLDTAAKGKAFFHYLLGAAKMSPRLTRLLYGRGLLAWLVGHFVAGTNTEQGMRNTAVLATLSETLLILVRHAMAEQHAVANSTESVELAVEKGGEGLDGEKRDTESQAEKDQGEDAPPQDPLEAFVGNGIFWTRAVMFAPKTAFDMIDVMSFRSSRFGMILASFSCNAALHKTRSAVEPSVVTFLRILERVLTRGDEDVALLKERCDYVVPRLVNHIVEIQARPVLRSEVFLYHCSRMLLSCAAKQPAAAEALDAANKNLATNEK
ncbi:Ubiquitin carboxyl-terminal hydrolase puf (Protein puffyeye) [Durusdinium trenchii]|uniref:Ubiquitin carboxyl-terminal hydrolase puf (Protein puffyeye) n=1 Tax=Durusdinium trenchii TaxID=1381693 RepID=A0ABP0SJV6_9DINO